MPLRPDNRPAETVWFWFEQEFAKGAFPNVSWALGSDWAMGSRPPTADQYKALAYKRMVAIYGPNPSNRE
jgi:hypothetical protein